MSAATTHLRVITWVEYGTDNYKVSLEWVPNTLTSYNVSVEPPYILTITSSLSNAKLRVSYNTHLNVSITARWCGQYTSTTIIHYGELSLTQLCHSDLMTCSSFNIVHCASEM